MVKQAILLIKNNNITRILILSLIMLCIYSISFAQKEDVGETPEQSDSNSAPESIADDSPFKVQETPVEDEPAPAEPDAHSNVTVTTEDDSSNSAAITPQNSNTDAKNFTTSVSLQGLNKITARTSKIEAKLGEPVKFGNLNITLRACWKSPPEEEPESKALIEVWEEIPDEPRKKIFSGWMFASSPLISAPEHPVYDITVLECTGYSVNTWVTAPPKN